MLKHVDAQINLDLHQFLEPEAKYNSRREHFSEHCWGPHFSLDARTETTEVHLQNFKFYFIGSLEQTMQRDANDTVIYGPTPAAIYPARPVAPSLYRSVPSSEHSVTHSFHTVDQHSSIVRSTAN